MERKPLFVRGDTVRCNDKDYVVIKDAERAKDGEPIYAAIRIVNGRGVGETVPLCEQFLSKLEG